MNKILEFVKEVGYVGNEHLACFPQEHPFTLKEFNDYTKQFMRPREEMTGYFAEDIFETYLVPIKESGLKFILRIMHGQGKSVTIFTEKRWIEFKKDIDLLKSVMEDDPIVG